MINTVGVSNTVWIRVDGRAQGIGIIYLNTSSLGSIIRSGAHKIDFKNDKNEIIYRFLFEDAELAESKIHTGLEHGVSFIDLGMACKEGIGIG